jgi:hypothetical protein
MRRSVLVPKERSLIEQISAVGYLATSDGPETVPDLSLQGITGLADEPSPDGTPTPSENKPKFVGALASLVAIQGNDLRTAPRHHPPNSSEYLWKLGDAPAKQTDESDELQHFASDFVRNDQTGNVADQHGVRRE